MNVGDVAPLTANLEDALRRHAGFRLDTLREINGWASGYFKPEDYMPRMNQTTAPVAMTTVELSPSVQTQLEGNLSTFNELKEQVKLLSEQMDVEKAAIRELMEANSVSKLTVGGCSLNIVTGVTNTIDWKKLHGDGIVSEAQKANYTVTKPKKAYLDIRGSDDNG